MRKKIFKVIAISSLMLTVGGVMAISQLNNRNDIHMAEAAATQMIWFSGNEKYNKDYTPNAPTKIMTDSTSNVTIEYASFNSTIVDKQNSSSGLKIGDEVYYYCVKTGGKTNNTRYLKVTIPTKYTAVITCYATSNSSGTSKVTYGLDSSSGETFNEKYGNKVTAQGYNSTAGNFISNQLSNGTYYLNFNNSARIQYLSVDITHVEPASEVFYQSKVSTQLGISGTVVSNTTKKDIYEFAQSNSTELLPTEIGKRGEYFTLAAQNANYAVGSFTYNSGASNGYYKGIEISYNGNNIIDNSSIIKMQFEKCTETQYAIYIEGDPDGDGTSGSGVYLVGFAATKVEFAKEINTNNANHLWTVSDTESGIEIKNCGVVDNILVYRPNDHRFNLYAESTLANTDKTKKTEYAVAYKYTKVGTEDIVTKDYKGTTASMRFSIQLKKSFLETYTDESTDKVNFNVKIQDSSKEKNYTYTPAEINKSPTSTADYYEIDFVLRNINNYDAVIVATYSYGAESYSAKYSVKTLVDASIAEETKPDNIAILNDYKAFINK